MIIKLKSFLKEGTETMVQYFLDPEGILYNVSSSGHNKFASDRNKTYIELIGSGWIRVASYGYMGQMFVAYNLKPGRGPNSIQKDKLIALAKEKGAIEILDNTNHNRYSPDKWE